MHTNQRIQHQQGWFIGVQRGLQSILMLRLIEAQRINRDDMDIETLEVDFVQPGKGFQPAAECHCRILRGI
jgi:hypothetical protein